MLSLSTVLPALLMTTLPPLPALLTLPPAECGVRLQQLQAVTLHTQLDLGRCSLHSSREGILSLQCHKQEWSIQG